ncbi:Cytochrome P450 [Melia azedarach]|uniref:Cytochrome P450 n=1 Tax=Melia azedarach TaxID=155640 RepID=A0ACC1WX07_MELAZ|nr:Cytochrome P450 [Melia azedarach]
MELQIFFSFTIFLLFLVLLFKTLSVCRCRSSKIAKSKTKNIGQLPPGPPKLPLIGNLYNLIGHKLYHRALGDLAKKYGPLMHLKLGKMSIVVASSPKMAEQVMKKHDLAFAQRPELLITKMLPNDAGKDIVSAPYGDYWRQMKKLCVLELLSAKKVQSFSSLREEEALNLVESIRESSASAITINLTEKLYSFTSNMLCRAAFGNKFKDQPAFIRLTNQMLSLAGGFTLSEIFPTLKFLHMVSGMKAEVVRVHEEAGKILDSIIHQHEKKIMNTEYGKDWEKEDLIDVLLRLQNSGSLEIPLATKDVKAVIWGMFIAGTDTSTTTATWAMSEMMRNPRVLHKAQAEVREKLKGKKEISEADIQELSYLKLVIKETLRLHPPAPLLFPRECRQQCEINGYKIPIKTKLFVNVWAIGRDPEYWENPESFIPERFSESSIDFKGSNFEYTPFGAGRRMCPGLLFGVHNLELPLSQMLYHFDWKLPDGIKPEELDMTEVFGPIVGRKNDLYLVATPYSS